MNKSYGKQGEQLLKSGGHSPSLDETMQQATLINISLDDMNHNRTTALERSVINYRGAETSFTPATSPSITDVVQTFS